MLSALFLSLCNLLLRLIYCLNTQSWNKKKIKRSMHLLFLIPFSIIQFLIFLIKCFIKWPTNILKRNNIGFSKKKKRKIHFILTLFFLPPIFSSNVMSFSPGGSVPVFFDPSAFVPSFTIFCFFFFCFRLLSLNFTEF